MLGGIVDRMQLEQILPMAQEEKILAAMDFLATSYELFSGQQN